MEALFSVRRELLAHAPEQYAKFSTLIAYPPRWLNEHLDVYQTATQSPPDQYLVDVISERIDVLLEHDCRSILSNLQIPALVMGTEDDQIVPPHLQQELASLLPRAQLHLFSHGGHLFPITRPRDVVVRMIDWRTKVVCPATA